MGFASVGVDQASHLRCLEIGRLLVDEGDETQGLTRLFICKTAGQRENGRHTAAIVICPGRAKNGIIMSADDDDLRRGPGYFGFNIVARQVMQLISVASGLQPSAGKRFLNEIGRSNELGIMIHVSFTDFTGEFLDIGA